ncbi:MAG: endonuclease V [Methanobacterium sp.]
MSIGHKISLKTAIKLVNETSIFKTPEPIRQSHILATRAFKEFLKIII